MDENQPVTPPGYDVQKFSPVVDQSTQYESNSGRDSKSNGPSGLKKTKRSRASIDRHLKRERDRNCRINEYLTKIHEVCPYLPTDKVSKETAIFRASQFIQFVRSRFSAKEWTAVCNSFIRHTLSQTSTEEDIHKKTVDINQSSIPHIPRFTTETTK